MLKFRARLADIRIYETFFLLVDDSRFLRIANERALVKAGHTVLSAADGEEGLRLRWQHRPDLVILDIMLPSFRRWTCFGRCANIPSPLPLPS